MEGHRTCKNCGSNSIYSEISTGDVVCRSCDVVQDFDNFQAHIGGINGPVGTYVHVGTTGTGNWYSYRETKIYEAKKVIDDLMYKFGITEKKADDVSIMIRTITEDEYGQGRWFSVLIGACSYIVMRMDSKVLPMEEAANTVGCDVFEMGRMVNRVVDFLDLELPELSIVNWFEKAIRNSSRLRDVSEDTISRMLKQGTLLLQCLVNWFVTTGRRPMPVVAAVLVFVAELNGITVRLGDVANELHVALKTCKLRHKELLERLVQVAQATLPWGKDVNMKNIMTNASSVIQYIELKSMSNQNGKCGENCDLSFLVDDCLTEENSYWYDEHEPEKDSQYFQAKKVDIPERFPLSAESFSRIYSEAKNAMSVAKAGPNASTRRRTREEYDSTGWWSGESDLSKELLLKQILEKNLGINAMPPSFDNGCLVTERRRAKINAAKLRIHQTMCGRPSASGDENTTYDRIMIGKEEVKKKKRKRKGGFCLDWEDFIIETLLLHKVREEEIEKGHYKALLGLHVFNGGCAC
ncbi:unnamed protein product [Cuscuta campestris]|uniref:TFIIB-type domain-containing protein n=1 Tax=Cuscuta campestris TaxID=132261 RepID=A0A484JZG6_9ASTE|nr:unnamed protein product [Cuscuta campestris]